jgi:hypothetical protein
MRSTYSAAIYLDRPVTHHLNIAGIVTSVTRGVLGDIYAQAKAVHYKCGGTIPSIFCDAWRS